MDLLFQGMVFFLYFQVKFGHLLATLGDFLAQPFATLPIQPIAEQNGDQGAPVSRWDLILKRCKGFPGQGIGTFYQIHNAHLPWYENTIPRIPLQGTLPKRLGAAHDSG
jgi:hypothetical protein